MLSSVYIITFLLLSVNSNIYAAIFTSRARIAAYRKTGCASGSIQCDGVAFTEGGKLVRKATGYEQEKLKPRYPTSGSRTARAELPAPIGASVTHRFLRRGNFLDSMAQS